ncbi:MAG: radical SAM protein [bacterium]
MITGWLEALARRESYRFYHRLAPPDLRLIKNELTKRHGEDKKIALYIHIPFCRTLCPYCSFVRYPYEESAAWAYMKTLRKELDLYLGLIRNTGVHIQSAYFGGGTPTLLTYPSLLDLINELRVHLKVKEISVETNPNDLDPQKIKDLAESGVSRLSIGVQSFSDEILHNLGRSAHHDSESAKRAVILTQGKFETVNVDMIWDLPNQDQAHLEKDIQTIFELDVDQVTFYPIVPSPNKKTLMERQFHQINQGLWQKNHRHRQAYEFIREALGKRYVPSTVWCFSKPGILAIDEYAIDYEEYIGLGCGSISIINGYYTINTFPLDKYHQFLARGELPIVRSRKLSGWELSNYRLLTGLFGVRINKQRIFRHFPGHREKELRWRLALFKKLGCLAESSNLFYLTPKGMYQVDLLMRQIFAGMNSLREVCLEGGI